MPPTAGIDTNAKEFVRYSDIVRINLNSLNMKKYFDELVFNFGFDNYEGFLKSMFHNQLLAITIPISLISATVEVLFGLKFITLIAFVVLLSFELITGIVASRIKGQRISSRKFSRFGFKLFTWLIFLFILNVFKKEYEGQSVISEVFSWLHSSVIIYVSLEYLISVLENIDTITGSDTSMLTRAMKNKIKTILGEDKDDAQNNNGQVG